MYAFAIWDGRDREAGDGPRPDGHQAALLLPDPRRRAVRLRAQGDPGQPAGRARPSTLDGLRELLAFVKTPGHAVWDGMREVRARAPSSPSTATGCASARYWRLETQAHTDDLRHHRRARARAARRHRRAASSSPTCRAARCSPAGLDSSRDHRARRAASWPSAASGCAASRSTSSARPRTSRPTRCAAPRTPRTCTTSPSTSAPTHQRHRPRRRTAGRPRRPRERVAGPGPPGRPRRHGRLAVPAVPGDPASTPRWRCPGSRPTRSSAATRSSTTQQVAAAEHLPVAVLGPTVTSGRRRRLLNPELHRALDLGRYIAATAYDAAVAASRAARRRESDFERTGCARSATCT